MPRRVTGPLVLPSAVVLLLLAAHDLSHALDDGLDTSPGALAIVAVPQWIVLAVVMGVVVRGDERQSALAALLLGVGVILGFAAVHLLPGAPASYWDLDPSAASWVVAWTPLVAGTVLAALASPAALRASRTSPSSRRDEVPAAPRS